MMLLSRPLPLRGESTLGYLLRIAHSNGLPTLQDFGQLLIGLISASDFRLVTLRDLVIISGHDEDVLSQRLCFLYDRKRKAVLLNGVFTGSYSLNLDAPRICPSCLGIQKIRHAVWDLTFVTVCDVHRVKLVDRCPACGRYLSWGQHPLAHCPCGKALESIPAEAADELLLGFQQMLLAKLSLPFVKVKASWIRHMPQELQELDIGHMSREIFLLMHSALVGNQHFGPPSAKRPLSVRVEDAIAAIRFVVAGMRAEPQFCLKLLGLSHDYDQRHRGPDESLVTQADYAHSQAIKANAQLRLRQPTK